MLQRLGRSTGDSRQKLEASKVAHPDNQRLASIIPLTVHFLRRAMGVSGKRTHAVPESSACGRGSFRKSLISKDLDVGTLREMSLEHPPRKEHPMAVRTLFIAAAFLLAGGTALAQSASLPSGLDAAPKVGTIVTGWTSSHPTSRASSISS